MQNKYRENYIPEFDALRGIAILLVLISHFFSHIWFLSAMGPYGVTLFFVLSGYLITRILLDEKHKTTDGEKADKFRLLKIFYIRRTLRIFPLYYAVLILLLIFNIDSARHYWQYYFSYTSNFLNPATIGYDRLWHFWSLAVEEQFYLVWPFLILLIPRQWETMNLFVAAAVFSLAVKFTLMLTVKNWDWYYLMPSCIESFAMGAIAGQVKNKIISAKKLALLFILFSGLTALTFIIPFIYKQEFFLYTCTGLNRFFASAAFAVLLVMILKGYVVEWGKKLLNNKGLLLLGKISYGVYLYHMFVPGIVIFFLSGLGVETGESTVLRVVYFFVTAGIAYLSFFFFELPISNFKKKYRYS